MCLREGLAFLALVPLALSFQRKVAGQEHLRIRWRGRWWRKRFFGRFRWWWRGFRHWPHMHSNGPVWLDHGFPDLGEDDLAVRSDEVVVAFMNVRANHIDMQKSLLDEFFHALTKC